METERLKQITEAILLAAARPLTLDQLLQLFAEEERPPRGELSRALEMLGEELAVRGVELKQVASGFRIQIRQEMQPWVARLWEEKPARYSRALLETLALIAYRQPVTRGEIEEVRGVSVSTSIMKTLQEREWVRIVGHRDVPGHPAIYGTTKQFLDYFNLKSIDELPALAELRDPDTIGADLELDLSEALSQDGRDTDNDTPDTPPAEPEASATGPAEDPTATVH